MKIVDVAKMMSNESETVFFIISKDLIFEETSEKGARLEATVMELDKVSEGNNRVYQIDEGEAIAKSLKNKPVYHGITAWNKHDNPIASPESSKEPVGIVEKAWVIGRKIKAHIRIISQGLIESLKQGVKFLFSVGGVALAETIKKIGDKIIHVLHGARCNHLQILDLGTAVGFPDAKMEKLIEINETVMFFDRKPNIPAERHIEIVGSGIAGFEIS